LIAFLDFDSAAEVEDTLAVSKDGGVFIQIDEGLLAEQGRTEELNISLLFEGLRTIDFK
jgi:hypothetical protein